MRLKKAAIIVGVLAAAAGLSFQFWFRPNYRRLLQDKSIATYQISAAVDQFVLENPDRLFVEFDDLIGPGKYIKGVFSSTAGEDYHEMFPIRVDFEELGVTMGDGRRVIVFSPRDPATGTTDRFTLRQTPDGRIEAVDSRRGGPEAYQKWLEARRKSDGVHREKIWDRRTETIYRGGVPDGLFRAYYEGGELWAEATYIKGRPVGPHVLYARNGKRIYETIFAAR